MDTQLQSILLFSIVATIIQYVIIRIAVAHGNNASRKDEYLYHQVALLSEIARKLGVEEEKISKIFEEAK